jgi:PAS domain S-box-containing protein
MSAKTYPPQRDRKQILKTQGSGLAPRNQDPEPARADADQREREFEAAFSSVAEAMLLYDASGQPVMANPATVAAYGFDPSKSDRASILKKIHLRHPDGKKVSLKDLPSSRALKGEKVVNERYIFTNAEGEELTVLTSAMPLLSKGRVSGAVAAWRDVTELEALREKRELLLEELRRANEEQRLADEAVRQSEEKYRAILENMEEGYYEVDLAGNFTFVNPAFAKMSGYPEKELSGTNYAEFLAPETAKRVYEAFNKVFASGEPFKGFDWTITRKDGTEFIMEISISLIRDDKGQGIGFRGIARDVTERRSMETRFRKERARLEAIVESAPVAIVVADEMGRVILANEIAAALYGRPVPFGEGLESHHRLHLCYPDGRPYNPNDLPLTRSVFHGESFSEVEMAVIWPDGTRKDLLVNSTPIRDPKGDVVGAVGIFQDVTGFMAQREGLRIITRELEKRVYKRTADLARSKENLETIIGHIPVMLCFYDPTGRVQLVNREFERCIGWSLNEARAMDIMEACYPDKEYRQEAWEYMMEAPPGWRDFKLTTRDGNTLDSSWANVRLSDGSQIGIGIDITERLQYEESLRRRNEELEAEIAKGERLRKALKASTQKIIRQHEQRKHLSRRLVELLEKDRRDVAMFLHDEIGQLLTTLKMDLEIAERRSDDPVLVRERLGAAKEKTLQALGFAKQVAAQLRPTTLDSLGFLASVRSLISTLQEVADFEIHFFTKGLPERLESEKELALYRIVQESLTNALKHSGAGNVFINLISRDDSVLLTVEDDGKGFDYKQITGSYPSESGSLGISIVRERAAQFGGSFRIESQPGKGTQVMVEIPI